MSGENFLEDKIHFCVNGRRSRFICPSLGEKVGEERIIQAVKYPERKCFGVVLATMELVFFNLSML